jgi:predicted outer membrane repeat protein
MNTKKISSIVPILIISVIFAFSCDDSGGGGSKSSVSLDATSLRLVVNETHLLTATSKTGSALVWSSSNPGFVSVSNVGLVTAESVGTATVIVTAVDGGDQARCTVTVGLSSTIIYVKADATGLDNGTSWKHAFTDLSDGIDSAIASGAAVFVARGTYTENIYDITGSVAVYGGFSGSGTVRNTTDYTTIVDGINANTIFNISTDGATVVIDGLVFTRGNSGFEGGALRIGYGTSTPEVRVNNCTFTSNSGQWGGALWNGPSAATSVLNCTFNNNAGNASGGAIRCYNGTSISVVNCSFTGNTAPHGGAINVGTGATLDATGCSFTGNTALTGNGFGGAVYNESATATFTTCTFSENEAISGGALYNTASTATIDFSVVSHNSATSNGGGVYNTASSTFNADRSLIEYNSATLGGGIYNIDTSNAWMDASRIEHNSASSHGGGVYNGGGSLIDMDQGGYEKNATHYCSLDYNTSGTYGGGIYCTGNSEADIRQCTAIGNEGTLGGAIYAYQSPVYAYNCVFYDNNATGGSGHAIRLYTDSSMISHFCTFYNNGGGTGVAIGMSGATLTLSSSIIWGHTTSISDAAQTVTDSNIQGGYAGAGNMDVDPGFYDTSNGAGDDGIWGTADDGLNLAAGSVMIDRLTSGQSRDITDIARPVSVYRPGTPYDIGAYEYQGP